MTPVVRINKHILLKLAYSGDGVWDIDEVNRAIDEKAKAGGETQADANISVRRQMAGYNELKQNQHLLYLYNGSVSKEVIETPAFQEMWLRFGNGKEPRLTDITIGILDKSYLVRLHPTPYGSWKHSYGVGHYIEWELEPIAQGVGSLGGDIQKQANKLLRYVNDVGKFNLFSMMLAGRGSGLKSNYMNIFPFSAIPVDDVNQIKPLQPNVDGIGHGLNLLKFLIEDHRGVTHASSTLQAIITGATATESSLAQGEAIRALSITAKIFANSVIRPYYQSMILNLVDQNPYDSRYSRVDVVPKLVLDKDYKPEHARKLIEFLNLTTTIRNVMPLDFNPMPILKYLARAVGINPREITQPRPQIDKTMDMLRRLNNQGKGQEVMETEGEARGAGMPDGNVVGVSGTVPNSPLGLVA